MKQEGQIFKTLRACRTKFMLARRLDQRRLVAERNVKIVAKVGYFVTWRKLTLATCWSIPYTFVGWVNWIITAVIPKLKSTEKYFTWGKTHTWRTRISNCFIPLFVICFTAIALSYCLLQKNNNKKSTTAAERALLDFVKDIALNASLQSKRLSHNLRAWISYCHGSTVIWYYFK